MFRPAGLSDSSSCSDDEFDDFLSSPRSRRRGRHYGGTNQRGSNSIDWDTFNGNNNQPDLEVSDEKDQKVLERTKKCIRSTLLASKGSTEMFQLDNEYFDMFEERIPFARFGFKTLEDFLKSIPSVCRVRQIGFSTFVEGVADAGTRHIKMMVSAQKTSGGGKKKRGRAGPRFDVYTPSFAPRQPAVRRPVAPARAPPPKPKVTPPVVKPPLRPVPAIHRRDPQPTPKQVPAIHKREPNTPAVKPSASISSTKDKSPMMNSILRCGASSVTSDPTVLLNVVLKYLRSVLLANKQGSMTLERLEIDYLKLTKECIPYEKLGFKSLTELLMSNSSVCKVISHNGNYLVSAVPTPETHHMQSMIAANANGVRSEKKKSPSMTKLSSALPKLQEVTMDTTADSDTLYSRVKELLKGRKFGLMITQLAKMYEKRFNERFPDQWRDQAESNGLVVEEKDNFPLVIKIQEEVNHNSETNGDISSVEQIIQTRLEKLNVSEIVSKLETAKECNLSQDIVESLRNILKPRKFGLFKKQAEKLYEKNTGNTFREEWWPQLEDVGLVTITLVVKWTGVQ